jgi:uncharacterized membrane protein YhhN
MAIGWTAVWVALLLFFEWREWRRGVWIAKPLASLGFLAAGIASGAGAFLLTALVLSFLGDVLLIPKKTFVAGLAAFLFAHVAFAVAFWSRGVDARRAGAAMIALIVVGAIVGRWLVPHVGKLKVPVIAYIVTIIAMASLAMGVRDSSLVPAGALMFFVSDLAVARDKFVAPGFANKSWGLPLYYAAQLLLAFSAL